MKPRYYVHFQGRGFTAPDEHNPNGVKVKGSGYIIVDGERPATASGIPFEAIVRCKQFFMKECFCVRYAGDKPGEEQFPTVRLGKAL